MLRVVHNVNQSPMRRPAGTSAAKRLSRLQPVPAQGLSPAHPPHTFDTGTTHPGTALQRQAARFGRASLHPVYEQHLKAYQAWPHDLRREAKLFGFVKDEGFMTGLIARIRTQDLSDSERQLALDVLQYGDKKSVGKNLNAEDCLALWDMQVLAAQSGALPLHKLNMTSLRRYFARLADQGVPQQERDQILLTEFWDCMSLTERDLRAHLLDQFFNAPLDADLKRLFGLADWKTAQHSHFDGRPVVVLRHEHRSLILDDAHDGELFFVSEEDHVATYPERDPYDHYEEQDDDWSLARDGRIAHYAGSRFKLYQTYSSYSLGIPLDEPKNQRLLGTEGHAGHKALVMVQREHEPILETMGFGDDMTIIMSRPDVSPEDFVPVDPHLLNFSIDREWAPSTENVTTTSVEVDHQPLIKGAEYRFLITASDGRYAYLRIDADQLLIDPELGESVLVAGQAPTLKQFTRVLQSLPFGLVVTLPTPLDVTKLAPQNAHMAWSDERLQESLIQLALFNVYDQQTDTATVLLMAALKDGFIPTNLQRVPQPFEGDLRKFWIDANAAYLRAPSDFAANYPSVSFVLESFWAAQNTNHRSRIEFAIDGAVLSD